MKILKLKFNNLNSLKGEWSIDFADPAFINDGLFAIVGPTGAGKTTILDAICLSLYGRTPRLDSITNSSNEIMNRVSTECFAQTTFSCDAGVFRSSFEQHYSSSKRGFNLQPPKMELANDSTNEILANSKSQVPLKVGELIGLTYEQFIRAVLLAQGQFKKFLDSNANDRSELLETITGTQIYSLISQKVFERSKAENAKLEEIKQKLSGIEILSDEQQKILKEEIEKSNSKTKTLQEEMNQLDKQIQWIKEVKKLKNESETIGRNIDKNNDELRAFESQREQLVQDVRAQKIVADYRVSEQKRGNLEKLDKQIDKDVQTVEKLDEDIKSAVKAIEKADETHNKAKETLNSQKPTIDKVKSLDTVIAEQRKNIEPEQKKLSQLQSQFAQECRKANITLDELPEDLTTVRIESQISEILNGVSISKTRIIIDDFNELKDHWKDLLKVKVDIADNSTSIEKFQKNIERYKKDIQKHTESKQKLELDISAAEKHQQSLEKNISFSKLFQSLEEHRQKLAEGERCPLCGATSHPYCIDLPSVTLTEDEKELDETKSKIRELRGDLSNTEKEITKFETKSSQANDSVKELEQKNEALQKQSDDICDNDINCDKDISVKEIKKRISLIAEKTQRTQNRLEYAEKLDALKNPVQLRETLNEQKSELKQKEDALNKLINERQELFGSDDPEQAFQQLSKAVDAAFNKLNDQKGKKTALEAKQTTTKQNLEARQEERKTAFKQFSESLAEFNNKLEEQRFSSVEDFLKALLTDDVRDKYQKLQKELDEQKTRLEEQQRINNDRLLKLEEQNLTDKSEEELDQSCNQKNAEYTALLVDIGSKTEQLNINEQNKNKFDKIKAQFDNQKEVVYRWEKLNSIIGSADGKKFRKIVQRISLEILIDYANEQMAILSPRYQLTLPQKVDVETSEENSENIKSTPASVKEDLAIYCIDSWQGGAVRPTTNLSGGESFLISLALALGLSKMSSRNKPLETLFLDEGFGTLDEETLQTALDAINKFQYSDDSNKLVGVISHVDALKERIANKIEVARSAAGASVLSGPGVTKIS
ncbi:MAG: AAA family ATPase [Thermoguttaceae bacterium]|nr:AAA family ATPase [Thermoguttaceae bacterium]